MSADGVVSGKALGETAVLVRGAGQVSSAGVGVIGPPIPNYPDVPRCNFIDEAVFDKLRDFHIVPSEVAGDCEFLRRVCLDLTGTLPPPQRMREFLASKDPTKREKVIDALIASPEFVDYWTFRFADIFRVAIFANGLTPKWSQEYWEWIRNNIENNRPYDEVARERIAADGYDPASRHFLPLQPDRPARRHDGRRGPRLHGTPPRLRAVPQPSLRKLEPGSVLGHGGLLLAALQDGTGGLRPSHEYGPGLEGRRRQDRSLHPRTKLPVKPALLDGSRLQSSRRNRIRARSSRAG